MKTIISLVALLTILLSSCKNSKNETVEKTIQTETVVIEEPKGALEKVAELIEADKLKNLMAADTELQLIDVRSPEEFAEGHLKDAVNININDANFNDEIQKLLRDEPIFLYCRSGGRSARAGKVVVALGYRAYDLDKGIQGWEKQGFPIQ
jgi:rhodanese-related sulfurtransferase